MLTYAHVCDIFSQMSHMLYDNRVIVPIVSDLDMVVMDWALPNQVCSIMI
jgi:hypothetical protein